MPNRNQFPLTGPPHREDIAFIVGAILLVLALFLLVSGPTLLSRVGSSLQFAMPSLTSNTAPQARLAFVEGSSNHTDGRYVALPELTGAGLAPQARVAFVEGSNNHTDGRYLAQPQLPQASAAPQARVAFVEGSNNHTDGRYLVQPELPTP